MRHDLEIPMMLIFENPRKARRIGKKLRERWESNGADIRRAALEVLRQNLVGTVVDTHTIIAFLSGVFGPSCDAYIRLTSPGLGEGFLNYSHCNPNITIKVYGRITYYQRIGKIIRSLNSMDLVSLGICTDDYEVCSIGARLRDGTEVFSLIEAKLVGIEE